MEKLKQSVSKTVKVLRSGKFSTISTDFLVPGDVFVLEPGLRIPADGEVLEGSELNIDESVLTGESVPVAKDTMGDSNSIYMGTLVIEGIGKALVKQTGELTKFGEIAKSLREDINPTTPIKIELLKLSKLITIVILVIIGFIFVLGMVTGVDLKEIFFTSVALGVSTIPEGLIISLTVTLALGMNRLLAKKALVKNLPAAETLGDVDVLCIDKTGTLTLGTMQVTDTDFTDKDISMNALAFSNNNSNFIDKAIVQYLTINNPESFLEDMQKKRKLLFPFSSEKKYTGSFDGERLYAVGAPEVILTFCNNQSSEWTKKVHEHAIEGSRTLALCQKKYKGDVPTRDDFKNMEFLGLVYIKDPIRENLAESLLKINQAGIEIKVITGDLKETAESVMTSLGMKLTPDETISGSELSELIANNTLEKEVLKIKLFYRTSPNQKLEIVKALQTRGKIVGMMGDGVNDSPALKMAEIGLVVDNATDVSKEVADVILLDSNFKTIEDAIQEGRNIMKNLRKIITFLLADSLTETVLILLSLIFFLPLPLTPVLLLWINIIEDGLPSLALAFEKSSPKLLMKKPKRRRQGILDRRVISLIILTSLIKDILFFALYFYLTHEGYDILVSRTIIFACISFSSLLFLFSAKTIDSNIWKEKLFNNRIVNLAFLSGTALLLLSIYFAPLQKVLGTTSLQIYQLGVIIVLSILSILFIEGSKYFIYKHPK
jgi:Ca2+-transporting ATPase